MNVKNIYWIAGMCLLLSFHCFSQGTVQVQPPAKEEKKTYWKFLTQPDHRSRNHFFMFGYSFLHNPIGKILGSTGAIPWAGINVARLFSRKIILGVVAEAKTSPGNWQQRPSGEFVAAFDSAFVRIYDNPLDSANSYAVMNALNDQNGMNVMGQNILNYGIAFAVCPSKFGGVLFQVKTGSTAYQINGLYGHKLLKNGAYDKISMTLTGNMIYELTFKPWALGGNAYIYSNRKGKNEIWKSIVVSVYYEQLNFKSAVFNGTKITQMVRPEFLSQYGVDNRVGFKVGLAFY